MIKVGVVGSTGRVGRLLLSNIEDDNEMIVSGIHVFEELNFEVQKDIVVTNSMSELLDISDVIIDFSAPEATAQLCEEAIKNPKPLVVATTGLDAHQQNLLKQASELMPVLYATNMSVGVALLKTLVEKIAATLKDFDIEIVEQHHRHKVDAPSGTALTLAEFAAKGRGVDLNNVRVSGRDGVIGARTKDEIGVMSLRGGDIVGRHTVGFYNDGEYIELNHTATSRETFSKGSIRAAKWLIGKEYGMYSINDALGLEV